MRTTEAHQINNELKIVKLSGQIFKVKGGYIQAHGHAFHHPQLGFLSFKDSQGRPYIPGGGKKALQSILDQGGFTNFGDVVWLKS